MYPSRVLVSSLVAKKSGGRVDCEVPFTLYLPTSYTKYHTRDNTVLMATMVMEKGRINQQWLSTTTPDQFLTNPTPPPMNQTFAKPRTQRHIISTTIPKLKHRGHGVFTSPMRIDCGEHARTQPVDMRRAEHWQALAKHELSMGRAVPLACTKTSERVHIKL